MRVSAENVHVIENAKGPNVETLTYGVMCKGLDFGLLNARNQLVARVLNPLMDKVMESIKKDRALRHGTDSETEYTVSLIVTSKRDIDGVN